MSSFELPSLYNFPPFFTRQVTDSTWKSQAAEWETLILNFARHERIFKLELHNATTSPGYEIFENKKINRRLSLETLQDIVEEMVNKGTAEWVGGAKGKKTEALLFWHTPEEWANLIWNWVNETGQNDQIVTFYEISQGELAEGQEFYEIDCNILDKAPEYTCKKRSRTNFQRHRPR